MTWCIRLMIALSALAILLNAASTAAVTPALATDRGTVESFYRDKTIRIIVGSAPGGTYDIYSRLLARHLHRHIPGHPAIIVQNRPGAGTLIAANAVYNIEPTDGTVIGSFSEGLLLQPGMIFTIEPMINLGTWEVKLKKDGWTVITRDRQLSAQFEHTVGVTEDGCEVFTLSPQGLDHPPW
jgi:hypothetical protein